MRAIQRIQREVSGRRPDRGQGESPARPDSAPVVEVLAREGAQKYAGFIDLFIRGGLRIRSRTVTDGTKVFTVNYQNGVVSDYAAARATPFLQASLRRFPEHLLMNALRRPEALRWLREESSGGRKYDVVGYADVDGDIADLYFDAQTHALSRVVRPVDDPVRGDVQSSLIYQDYQRAGAFLFPSRWITVLGRDTVGDVRVTATRFDAEVPDSMFADAAGTRTAVPNSPPTLVSLGADAYAIKGFYNSAFVVFKDYVLLLEAPVSSGYQESIIPLIRGVAGDKPIRYVVSTHFHFDHIGGVRPYIARGATIVTTEAGASIIRAAAGAKHTLRPDTLSKAPVEPHFEVLRERRTFSDGQHIVELITLHDMPHVGAIIVAYIPAIKTLFEGDLYDSYAVEEAPATDDTEKLLPLLGDAKLAVDQIIPVHGPIAPVSVAALARAQQRRK